MSKVIKKVVKSVKKSFKIVNKFVKKYWKQIAIAAAIVFTAGAFAVVAAGGTWGTAFASIGTTFSAGAASLTGGLVGTSAASAAASGALGTTALIESQIAAQAATNAAAGIAGNGLAAATTSVATGGLTIGNAMMANTAFQAFGAYQDGKAEEKRQKIEDARYNSQTYYGVDRLGNRAEGLATPTLSTYIPGQTAPEQQTLDQSSTQPVVPQAPNPDSVQVANLEPSDPSDPSDPQANRLNPLPFEASSGFNNVPFNSRPLYQQRPSSMDDLANQQYGFNRGFV